MIKITKNVSFNKKDAPKIIAEISGNHGNKKIFKSYKVCMY